MTNERFKVGDRVSVTGWVAEADRHGTVVECYRGAPSATDKGVPMVAVKWDGGDVQRGYLNDGHGWLQPESLSIPSMRVVD